MPSCIHATTVAEGIKFGTPKVVRPVGERAIMDVFNRYRSWIDKYHGGMAPLNVAVGINHESYGNPLNTSDTVLKESGLWSLLPRFCEGQNIDPFDPEANIWGGCKLRNDRVRSILADSRYSWLADADPYDYTFLVWMYPGSIGLGGWRAMMNLVFPSPPRKGSSTRKNPYAFLRAWVISHAHQVPMLGRMNPGVVACRTVKSTMVDWLKLKGSLAVPGVFRVPPRPPHLPPWNAAKFNLIWSTSEDDRPSRFPEYIRVAAPFALGSLAGLAALIALAAGGVALWKRRKRARGTSGLAGRRRPWTARARMTSRLDGGLAGMME